MEIAKHLDCNDLWSWSNIKSPSLMFLGQFRTVLFHHLEIESTAGVRGTRVLNNGCYFWQLHVTQPYFTASTMFGIGTCQARLRDDAFVDLLGRDEHSWGLSHTGVLCHNGERKQFTTPLTVNSHDNPINAIGLVFDGYRGTLTYYKNNVCLGIAFTGLDQVKENLYPIVSSTAPIAMITLVTMRRNFISLQDRCRYKILKSLLSHDHIEELYLPTPIKSYLTEEPHENDEYDASSFHSIVSKGVF